MTRRFWLVFTIIAIVSVLLVFPAAGQDKQKDDRIKQLQDDIVKAKAAVAELEKELAALKGLPASSAWAAASDKELDPGNLFQGDAGRLLKAGSKLRYIAHNTEDFEGEVLVVCERLSGKTWGPVARFMLRLQSGMSIEQKSELQLDDVYQVKGTRTLKAGTSLAVLSVMPRH